ncbi:MAG: PSD1 and planctomycete cytochrome C domain-containing protein [Planctomycetota bacterium]|nr:PSD1 and planctomycete cytochrome C domain-containing protein [Planctomycetota bacterium]
MGISFFSSNPLPIWALAGLLIWSSCGLSGGLILRDNDETTLPINFSDQVRPILSQHCFACHGPDEKSRKAGLSLLDFASATRTLESGYTAIVAGNREESELWLRITSTDDPMPPSKEHDELSPEQVEILGRWIDEGAEFAPHWAYLSPRPTTVPDSGENWPASTIDHYILDHLRRSDLDPAPDADATTLIRRLHLDLAGLPPAVEDVERFISGVGAEAYLEFYLEEVDRLLESPHFGERFATFWLDLVRYADTVGYHGDQEHHSWLYRDWVIGAFNSNLPFDQFTIEQIAGDLLDSPDQDQLLASGYNRLLQTTHEGGLQLKEYRSIYMADRIRNLSETWLGGTLGCAQCHDHKYDPYTSRDYYSFGAFFADIDDEEHLRNPYGGLNTTPTRRKPEMRVITEESREQQRQLDLEIEQAEQEVEQSIENLAVKQDQWEQQLIGQIESGERHQYLWVDDVLDTGGTISGRWNFVKQEGIAAHSGELYRKQSGEGLIQHYTVGTTDKKIIVGEGDLLFAWIYQSQTSPPTAVMLQCNIDGDWEHRAVWGSDAIAYGRKTTSDAAYQRMGPLPVAGQWVRIEVPFESLGLKPGSVVTGVAFTQFGGTVYWDLCGSENASVAPASVVEILTLTSAQRTDAQRQQIHQFHCDRSPTVMQLRGQLTRLKTQASMISQSSPLALYTRSLEEPRTVRIQARGNWLDEEGEIVEPAVPAFLGTLDTEQRATRLDLARWLVRPESKGGVGGLTARVLVNRVWAQLFGTGLCPSVEDFGGQGRPVTHPQLLDALAIEFIDSGWDLKALIRKMVQSRTYRQSSIPAPQAVEIDPENLLFSHQARHRFSAEMVRDASLKISGLLVDQLGGPGVKPPQPPHYYRHLNFPTRRYQPDIDSRQWRRGVYLHWQRQYLHPMLLAFDAPSRENCTAQRNRSNTPMAALVLLNDPVFVEAARSFARRIFRWRQLYLRDDPEGGDPDHAAIAFAIQEAVSREPQSAEKEILFALLESSRDHFEQRPEMAKEYLGASPVVEPEMDTDSVELAAWSEVARAILNLKETMTRE